MSKSRRFFMMSAGAITAGFVGLRHFAGTNQRLSEAAETTKGLVPDRDGKMDLPPGFSYSIVSRQGEEMSDGLLVPSLPDGMGAFPGPNGLTIIVRNHEVYPHQLGPFGKRGERLDKVSKDKIYDFSKGKASGGGTTTLVYDTREQRVVREFLSLAGTYHNCAGGVTPWNSWISCEEATQAPGKHKHFVAEKYHGYNFEVPATAKPHLVDPVPLKAMGRFNHEAIAISPKNGVVYQTEDRGDGLIYRFIPNVRTELVKGGKLQALMIRDQPSADTRNWTPKKNIQVGTKLAVKWIDLENIDPPKDDLRIRGSQAGAATFARGEGMFYGNDGVYFVCTNGGIAQAGQIWKYTADGDRTEVEESGTLELFVEPNNAEVMYHADNITVAPWGDLIVCEDRAGDTIRLIGITPEGRPYTFAHSHMNTEFAGVIFSPDGSTMFVNAQGKGFTFAITGPWQSARG